MHREPATLHKLLLVPMKMSTRHVQLKDTVGGRARKRGQLCCDRTHVTVKCEYEDVCVRLEDSRVGWWLDEDGWMRENRSFMLLSQCLSYSSVCITHVYLPVWCTILQLPLMDHSKTPPSCLRLHLCVPCGHLLIAQACTAVWRVNVHLSVGVDIQLQLCSLLR